MKLGAVTMAYRDEATIRGTLACLNPYVEAHYVFINDKPYNGVYEPPDRTEEICKEFDKVHIIKGNWEEHVLRNIGIEMCSDCDWMIGFDADEMMTGRDIELLKNFLRTTDKNFVGVISKVYWHSIDYIFNPDPDHVKVCLARCNSSAQYIDKQCVSQEYDIIDYKNPPNITHHHLSYCLPKDIKSKVLHYNHAKEFDGSVWYEEHFAKWKPGDEVVQPFGTKWRAVYDPLPVELRKLL